MDLEEEWRQVKDNVARKWTGCESESESEI